MLCIKTHLPVPFWYVAPEQSTIVYANVLKYVHIKVKFTIIWGFDGIVLNPAGELLKTWMNSDRQSHAVDV